MGPGFFRKVKIFRAEKEAQEQEPIFAWRSPRAYIETLERCSGSRLCQARHHVQSSAAGRSVSHSIIRRILKHHQEFTSRKSSQSDYALSQPSAFFDGVRKEQNAHGAADRKNAVTELDSIPVPTFLGEKDPELLLLRRNKSSFFNPTIFLAYR